MHVFIAPATTVLQRAAAKLFALCNNNRSTQQKHRHQKPPHSTRRHDKALAERERHSELKEIDGLPKK